MNNSRQKSEEIDIDALELIETSEFQEWFIFLS